MDSSSHWPSEYPYQGDCGRSGGSLSSFSQISFARSIYSCDGSATGGNGSFNVAFIIMTEYFAERSSASSILSIDSPCTRHGGGVPFLAPLDDAHVLGRLAAHRDRPVERVAVFRIDILVDRDNVFSQLLAESEHAVERAPHFVLRRAVLALDDDVAAKVHKRLVAADADNPLVARMLVEVAQQHRLHTDLFELARLARRHLTEDADEDRVFPVRDAADLEHRIHDARVNVSVRLAERALGLEIIGESHGYIHPRIMN